MGAMRLHRHEQLPLSVLLLCSMLVANTASAATVYSGSGSSSVRYVPVHSPGFGLLQPGGGTGLVKVIQSGYKYSSNVPNYGYGSSGGYVYYDQLPTYGKGYGSGNGYANNGYSSSNSYGGNGYVHYDQLPSYGKGYGTDRSYGYDNGYNSYDNGYGNGYDNSYGENDFFDNVYNHYGAGHRDRPAYGGYYGDQYPTGPRRHRGSREHDNQRY